MECTVPTGWIGSDDNGGRLTSSLSLELDWWTLPALDSIGVLSSIIVVASPSMMWALLSSWPRRLPSRYAIHDIVMQHRAAAALAANATDEWFPARAIVNYCERVESKCNLYAHNLDPTFNIHNWQLGEKYWFLRVNLKSCGTNCLWF